MFCYIILYLTNKNQNIEIIIFLSFIFYCSNLKKDWNDSIFFNLLITLLIYAILSIKLFIYGYDILNPEMKKQNILSSGINNYHA